MVVLGIETATSVLSVGLASGGKVLNEMYVDENYAHAEKLPGLIQQILHASAITGSDLDLIAVSNGPGSFTGLRIGLALAKGLAMGWQCPLIAVPTLDGMAMQLPSEAVFGVILLTARKGEVYQGLYRQKDHLWRRNEDIQCIEEENWGNNVDQDNVVFAGEGTEVLYEIIQQRFPNATLLNRQVVRPNGAVIAKLGDWLYSKGERTDLNSVVPFYHKRFQGVA